MQKPCPRYTKYTLKMGTLEERIRRKRNTIRQYERCLASTENRLRNARSDLASNRSWLEWGVAFAGSTQADIDMATRRVEGDERTVAEEEREKASDEADLIRERMELIALLAERTTIRQDKLKNLRRMR